MRTLSKLLAITLLISGLSISLVAQNKTAITDIDGAFKKAQALAWDGKYKDARSLCDEILNAKPNYYDASFLLGKINSWEKRYPEALVIFEELLKITQDSRDLIIALIDTETWAGDFPAANGWIKYGFDRFPDDPDPIYKQALVYQGSGDLAKAQLLIDELKKKYPDRKEFRNIYNASHESVRLNGASVEYTINYTKLPVERTWNMLGFKYYKTNKVGTFIGGINSGYFGNDTTRFMENGGIQFELDAYPVIPKTRTYFHLNIGLSPSSNFARQKLTPHIYQGFGKGWELSAGFNYMNFKSIADTNKVFIADAGLLKYLGNYFACVGISISPIDQKIARGYTATVRRYFSSPENWLQLTLGTGMFPDNPLYYLSDPNYVPNQLLASYNVLLAGRCKMSDRWIGRIYSGYQYEEYRQSSFRNNWTVNLALIYLFKDKNPKQLNSDILQ
ncbi:MAG: YaiO family outer membrane beta-barrel protein [Bacteroidota bacterium]